MKRLAFFLISLSTALLRVPVTYSAEVTQDIDASFQQVDVDSNESKFEEYGEKPSGVTVDDYYLKSIGEKVNLEVEIKDLRLEQQAADVKLQGANTTLKGSWDQVPHLYSTEARTLYVNNGNGVLRLPDQLQSAIQSTPFTSTNSAVFVPIMASYLTGAQPVELKTRTDTGKVDINHEFSNQWRSSLSFSQQKKHGTRAKSATFGFNNDIEVALPVDEDTYNSNLGLNYIGKKIQAGLLYNFSTYENHIDTLVWDNPKRATDRYTSSSGYSNGDQSSQGRMSLSPDNIAHNVLLTFGINLPYKSRVTANVGYNNHAQNETLLPYTINTAINTTTALTGNSKPPFDASNPANRPADKADAKIITWTQNYDLTTDWSKKVRSKLKFDSIQINNKTPELSMPGEANIDQVWVVGTVENKAYESRRDNIEGQVDYAICSAFKVNGSFGEAKTTRMHREVREQKEDTMKVGFDLLPLKATKINVQYLNAKREMDEFDTAEEVAAGEIPGLRRFDVADRTRNQGRVNVQTQIGRVDIGLNGMLGHDKFEPGKGDLTNGISGNANLMYGVQDVRNAGAGVDVDAQFERFGIFAYYNYEQAITKQRSVTRDNANALQLSTNTWVIDNDDRYDTAGIGVDMYAVKDLIDVRLGYDVNRSYGTADITDKGRLNKTSPPETRTTKQDYYIQGLFRVKPTFTVKVAYTFEKYDISDYTAENIDLIEGASAGQSSIFLGDSVHDYKAHIYAVSAQYKFGG